MMTNRFMNLIPGRRLLTRLILGSVFVALVISLGMVGIVGLFGFTLNPAIPSAFAATGAAIFAARMSRRTRGSV
jgi:hypothetical protein